MSPRPDVSEERTQQIIEAAMAVFSRLGFDKTRMDDIVQESGLSKGALYWYFKSKDDLIVAILDNLFGRELTEMQDLPNEEGSAGERLLKFMERSLADLKRMSHLMPITYEFYALAFRNKAVQKTMKHYLKSYLAILEPLIQQGIERGEFRPVDVRQAALAISAIFEGTLLLWVYDPKTVQIEKQIEAGCRMLMAGLQTQDPAKA
jgi:AcrR family transcriptional regulator